MSLAVPSLSLLSPLLSSSSSLYYSAFLPHAFSLQAPRLSAKGMYSPVCLTNHVLSMYLYMCISVCATINLCTCTQDAFLCTHMSVYVVFVKMSVNTYFCLSSPFECLPLEVHTCIFICECTYVWKQVKRCADWPWVGMWSSAVSAHLAPTPPVWLWGTLLPPWSRCLCH